MPHRTASGTLPRATSYRLAVQTEAREGIRRWYLSRYTLFRRDATGHETEVWRDERQERYGSHKISADGTVWVATESVPGPGGGGRIWMRRGTGSVAAGVGTQNLVLSRPSRSPGAGPSARTVTVPFHPTDLSHATAVRLGSGAEQLRFESESGREARLTWLDNAGVSQWGQSGIARWTVSDAMRGSPDPWTEALDRAPHPPSAAELTGDGPLRFWESGGRTLALRSERGWWWDWPIQIDEVALRKSPPVGFLTLSAQYLWFDLEPGAVPRLRIAGDDGRIMKSLSLASFGYATSERLRGEVAIEDGRILSGWRERVIASIDRRKEAVSISEVRYPTKGGGRLLVVLSGGNAPRIERQSPASVVAQLTRKESPLGKSHILDERIVASPSGAFRLRIRRRSNPWEQGEPMGYLTLLGRRWVDGTEIEVEMFANVFYGNAPVEAQVLDDGRVATVDHHPDRVTLTIWNPDGTQIAGIELTQGWYPSVTAAKRGFHLAGTPYRIEGGTTTRKIEGVRVTEPDSATWTLPVAGGVRQLHLARIDGDQVRTWWQG